MPSLDRTPPAIPGDLPPSARGDIGAPLEMPRP
jgi:hypothetical protein